MVERMVIWKKLRSFDVDCVDFKSLRDEMAVVEDYYSGYESFEIRMEEAEFDSDRQYPYVFGKRLETEEEAGSREAKEQEQAKAREDRERAEFARLAAKFGG